MGLKNYILDFAVLHFTFPSAEFRWHGFAGLSQKSYMVVPFIALIVIIIVVIVFMAKAGKRKNEGKDLGETGQAGGGL